MKTCLISGCQEEAISKSKCKKHYNEYMNEYMKRRYHRRRAEYVQEWGGKCVDCGSTDCLEFDHVAKEYKSFNLAKAFSGWSDDRVRQELSKCVLRCKPCHIKKSLESGDLGIKPVDHGGGVSGKKNCKCDACKTKKNEYVRSYRAKYGRKPRGIR